MTNGKPIDPRLATLLRQGMRSQVVDAKDEPLEMQIRVQGGKVYLVMNQPVPWFGLEPAQARNLAGALVEGADKAEAGRRGGVGDEITTEGTKEE